MIDGVRASVWAYRGLFVFLAFLLLFLRLLPLGSQAGDWPGPDVLLCLIFAWMVRRPDFLPVLLVAAVVMLEDMILQRPPGLWTALVIVAAEFTRSRIAIAREFSFFTEWLAVAALMMALLVANRMVLSLFMLPQVGFGFALVQVIWSILCYPAVVALSVYVFHLHKPGMGEIDAYGRRL